MKKVKLRKLFSKARWWNLASREGYKIFAIHFGVFCGLLTILGLVVGVYSYYKTIKPALDFEILKSEVSLLENEKNELSGEIISLDWEIKNLRETNSDLETKGNNLTVEVEKMGDQLAQMEDEVIFAQADAYMSPIIYLSMVNNIYKTESGEIVKEFALTKLAESSAGEKTKSQEKVLLLLNEFINEEITSSSKYNDLLGYRMYLYQNKLEEMGIKTKD